MSSARLKKNVVQTLAELLFENREKVSKLSLEKETKWKSEW